MILFDDGVEVFDLADLDACLSFGLVAFNRRGIGTALVDRDLLGRTVPLNRFAQEPVRILYETPIKSMTYGFSIVVIWVGLPRTADRGRGFRDGGGAGDARRSSAGSGEGM